MGTTKLLPVWFVILSFIAPAWGQDLKDLKLPPVEKQPWRFTGFPILAWWAPPGNTRFEDFQNYKDAGFTIYPAHPDSCFEKSLAFAARAGLKIMPFRAFQGFNMERKDIVFPKDNDSIVGWITHDEPSGIEGVTTAITAVNSLMRQDPSRWTIFNFLPPPAQQNPDTRQVIAAAVRNGLPILSFDNYVILKDGSDNTRDLFNNLELFRQASLEYHVPFWAFALSLQHWGYRRPSESDIRWKQYTNLAYGAKGLWYFTYWGPTDWENWDNKAIVDPSTGSKTELYEYVKTLNHAILDMGDILLRLTNIDVFHTNPPDGHRAFPQDKYWISDINAQTALVSFFHDDQGQPYALVVNQLHGLNKSAQDTADHVQLTFAPPVKSVRAVNWLNGQPGPLRLTDHKTDLLLFGGTGALLTPDIEK